VKITTKVIEKASDNGILVRYRSYLKPEGLDCKEVKFTQGRSDYFSGKFQRFSSDNGKTWTEWEDLKQNGYSYMYGGDEMMYEYSREVYNPVHNHYVSTKLARFFLEGHDKAYDAWWNEGAVRFFDHQHTIIRNPEDDEPFSDVHLMYEEGAKFDPENPRNPEYLNNNWGYLNAPIVLKNGDIAVPVSMPVRKACEKMGLDVNEVFPSSPDWCFAVMVARGKYNPEKKEYDFTFSNLVILNDLQSSRGIDEPVLAELENGRIILVMRSSNVSRSVWNTRIEPNSPCFKWYSFSDDGGKTFCQPLIWHFDNREVIYSPATISEFIRSSKNGKLYWIGNITDHTAFGNMPRYPLCIVEIDDTTGQPKKQTFTVIDTRREGESEVVQLSNFYLIEDRETKNIELTLAKVSQYNAAKTFYGETWLYEIDVEG